MSIEKAKAYLRQFGAEDRVIEFPVSSATGTHRKNAVVPHE